MEKVFEYKFPSSLSTLITGDCISYAYRLYQMYFGNNSVTAPSQTFHNDAHRHI